MSAVWKSTQITQIITGSGHILESTVTFTEQYAVIYISVFLNGTFFLHLSVLTGRHGGDTHL